MLVRVKVVIAFDVPVIITVPLLSDTKPGLYDKIPPPYPAVLELLIRLMVSQLNF